MQTFEAQRFQKAECSIYPLTYERNVCMMYRQSPVASFDLYFRHRECFTIKQHCPTISTCILTWILCTLNSLPRSGCVQTSS